MAHGRQGPDIVMQTRYAGVSEIRAVSDHEENRTPDGSSAIDPDRSHLNCILHGPSTQQEALDAMWEEGVRKPSAQAESPYVQMVISASPSFFDAANENAAKEKLDQWTKATMEWLRSEYDEDLAHVSLHLDETTPHMHVLVVPTYERKNRKPSHRKKSGETIEDFKKRLREWENNPKITRTAGRSSSKYWSKVWCRRDARVSYHRAVEHLGLGYGEDFVGDNAPSPDNKKTGTWVREEAKRLADERLQLEAERASIATDRAATIADAKRSADRIISYAAERELSIVRGAKLAVKDIWGELEVEKKQLSADRAQFHQDRADLEADRHDLNLLIEETETLRQRLRSAFRSVVSWLKGRELSQDAKDEAKQLIRDHGSLVSSPKEPGDDTDGPGF